MELLTRLLIAMLAYFLLRLFVEAPNWAAVIGAWVMLLLCRKECSCNPSNGRV